MAAPSGVKPAAGVVGEGAAKVRLARGQSSEGRRVAVVAGALVALGLVVYLGYRSPYWPFRLKQVAVAGEVAPTGGAEASSAETAPARAAPPASVSVQAVEHRGPHAGGVLGRLGRRVVVLLEPHERAAVGVLEAERCALGPEAVERPPHRPTAGGRIVDGEFEARRARVEDNDALCHGASPQLTILAPPST